MFCSFIKFLSFYRYKFSRAEYQLFRAQYNCIAQSWHDCLTQQPHISTFPVVTWLSHATTSYINISTPICNPVIDLIGWRIKSLNTALRVGKKYCLIWKVRINIKGFSCSSLTIFSKSLKRRTVSSQWSRQNETKWPRIWTSGIVWMMIRRRNNTSIR